MHPIPLQMKQPKERNVCLDGEKKTGEGEMGEM